MAGICAFFGHRDVFITDEIEREIKDIVLSLIQKEGFIEFWCCNEGVFDETCRRIMLDFAEKFYQVILSYVSAYDPDNYSKSRQKWFYDRFYVMYPDELKKVPARAAIIKRNEYIADHADVLICYVDRTYGGAYKAMQRAQQNGKRIFNIAAIIKARKENN